MIKKSIIKAYNFSKELNSGKERKFSGLPAFSHPKFVARVLEELNCNETQIVSGLLHDTREDNGVTYDEIKVAFGKEVADVVEELTNNSEDMKIYGGKRLYLANKLCTMSSQALTVKLADRYHNVLFLEDESTPLSFIKKYSKETEFILDCLRASKELKQVQLALIKRIDAILAFLYIRYKF